jgi:hypothetical protein
MSLAESMIWRNGARVLKVLLHIGNNYPSVPTAPEFI